MEIAVLARMRDIADVQNICPVLEILQAESADIKIACDTGGMAYHYLAAHFPNLLPTTKEISSAAVLLDTFPKCRVYLSSMQSENIGREPITHYQKNSTWTAVIQETPGWRLDGWKTYPDAVFTMPGGNEVITERWSNFTGETVESGMPQYEKMLADLKDFSPTDTLTELTLKLKNKSLLTNDQALTVNLPANYARPVISLLEKALPKLEDIHILARIHPKASESEKESFRLFYDSHERVTNAQVVDPLTILTASQFVLSTITSTTLMQASLAGATPIALTTLEAMSELKDLSVFNSPSEFP